MKLKIIVLKIAVFFLVLSLYLLVPTIFAMIIIYVVPETAIAWIATAFFCLGLYYYWKIKIAELAGILSRKIEEKEAEKAEL